MNNTVWKFELKSLGLQTITLPINAEILTIQTQRHVACMWALVDPESSSEERHFNIVVTNYKLEVAEGATTNYINTFQVHGGDLVYHVFEIIK